MANLEKFREVLPFLADEIREDLSLRGAPSLTNDHLQQCLIDNTQGGKLHRGLTVVDTGHALQKRPLTPTEFQELSILGWLTEIFQASYLISDDIMDNSEYRRGKQCWYRRDGVGLAAINDATLLKSSIFILLQKNFRQHSQYLSIVELFIEAGFRTELGQLCDARASQEDRGFEHKSIEMYSFITINKTAFYSFYLPVALALHYFGLADERNLGHAERILLPMGEYFQVQDDYLDVFGDPYFTGKVGTDIQDNKCTWLILEALRHCSAKQRQVLMSCYGRQDEANEANVKEIFEELYLPKRYREYETEMIQELQHRIDRVGERNGLKEVFQMVLGKISRRNM
ncbi:hypothetical protein N7530_008840 [Penicillium desertorum]|uniref:Farnesyl diphosphate synthase n=1 Tax=Penicillium desertorum TaxID=1303715 RepID=A0A9W9WQG8_9EURO|nr:hypothetical protein N7530_008840 [Penicillium desertorum]